MNLWLDDLRSPPGDREWVHVRTVNACRARIKRKCPQRLSLDNDLGERQPEGRSIIDWLEERAMAGFPIPDQIHIHSANPVARAYMELVRERIFRIVAEREDG